MRELKKQLATAEAVFLIAAQAISKRHDSAARELQKLVEAEINQLAMKAQFRIEVQVQTSQRTGVPQASIEVAYLISPNPGEPLKPVEQIASGGELSRVMLALKATIEAGKKSNGKHSAR